jgi:hypothetical protein
MLFDRSHVASFWQKYSWHNCAGILKVILDKNKLSCTVKINHSFQTLYSYCIPSSNNQYRDCLPAGER